MKILKTVFIALFVMSSLHGCNSQTSEKEKVNYTDGDKIEIYYFHFTKRCATCNAIEKEIFAVLETHYSEKVEEGLMSFISLNLDEEENKAKAKKLEVSGQTLLLVEGKNKVNLTNDGFMNARNNPEKFHEILLEQINKLL